MEAPAPLPPAPDGTNNLVAQAFRHAQKPQIRKSALLWIKLFTHAYVRPEQYGDRHSLFPSTYGPLQRSKESQYDAAYIIHGIEERTRILASCSVGTLEFAVSWRDLYAKK